METPKKRNYLLMILLIIIILLVIWILYLLMNRSDTKMQNPTGNVDIFFFFFDKDELCENIIIPTPTPTENPFDNDSSNEENQNQTQRPGSSSDSNHITDSTPGSGNVPDDSEPPEEPITGNLQVSDSNVIWSATSKLNIFENPAYDMQSVIAPLSSNAYEFVIKNGTNLKVNYNLNFQENNDYQLNMKYRLKKNGTYLVGSNISEEESNWVTYQELSQQNILIDAANSDTYILEWKWFESENDTEVSQLQSEYTLNISLTATQTTNE